MASDGGTLRFAVGARVSCNMGRRRLGEWRDRGYTIPRGLKGFAADSGQKVHSIRVGVLDLGCDAHRRLVNSSPTRECRHPSRDPS